MCLKTKTSKQERSKTVRWKKTNTFLLKGKTTSFSTEKYFLPIYNEIFEKISFCCERKTKQQESKHVASKNVQFLLCR